MVQVRLTLLKIMLDNFSTQMLTYAAKKATIGQFSPDFGQNFSEV
jgi:hypothetical protein